MSSDDADQLYALLPAFVRLRDQARGGGALGALIAVIASQAQVVGAGLDQLYDDQFIETCAPWAVPYIGDLVGFRPLRSLGPGTTPRAEVADTIGYRRRKGTLAMLEQLSFDVTGWPAVAVEFFARLATTQYVRSHLRPGNAMVDVRSPMTASDIGGPFDVVPRTAEMRRISSGRGRYNIADIGVFVWRLKAYPTSAAPARNVGANRYTFDPFGGDVPLVNPPPAAPTGDTFALTPRTDLPFPLLRYPLYAGVEPYAQETNQDLAQPGQPMAPFGVAVAGARQPWSSIAVCDLADWTPPTAAGVTVAVDPERGRLVFSAPAPAAGVAVTADYTYAFSGDYGGGNYPLSVAPDEATIEALLPQHPAIAAADCASLATVTNGVVGIGDSGIYLGGDVTLAPEAAGQVVVTATDDCRPVVAGSLAVTTAEGAAVTLRGLGVGGQIRVAAGAGGGSFTLRLEHCTVRGGLTWPATVSGTVVLDHCLCGPLAINPAVDVEIADSLIDSGSPTETVSAVSAGSVTMARTTVLGSVAARDLPLVENSIVTGPVTAEQRQAGCVRYSYLTPAGSQTPRRFRCQPDLAIDAAVADGRWANPGLTEAESDAITTSVVAWLRPAFTSRTPGQPGYGQLTDATPDEIRFGAEEGDEMGVFCALYGARRDNNLAFRLKEYLRIGLEVGIIHAS